MGGFVIKTALLLCLKSLKMRCNILFKRSKYGAKKVEKYGRKWDSRMELDFYEYLLELKEKGEIIDIELQPKFLLQEKFTYQGKTIRKIEYISDFRIKYSDGKEEVIDCKGIKTTDYKLKEKLVKFKYPDTIFKCVQGYCIRNKKYTKWREI